VEARDAAGRTVADTLTDGAGQYFLNLAPGDYAVVVTTGARWPYCATKSVTVIASGPVRADVSCDTGLR
jgi:hypothetical protein